MRTINIIGEINEENIKNILEEIFLIEKQDNEIIENNSKLANKDDHKKLEDLYVNISSEGGKCYGAAGIFDALSNLKCKVITRAFGSCCSAGLIIFLAGEERYAGRNTEFLHHVMSYGLSSNLINHIDISIFQKKIQGKFNEIIINRTNITKEMLEKNERKEWFMTYEEALELGITHGEI